MYNLLEGLSAGGVLWQVHRLRREAFSFEVEMGEAVAFLATFFLTVVTSVLVFVIGQIISRFVIEPIHEHRKIRLEIGDDMVFHARALTSVGTMPEDAITAAEDMLRRRASQLKARTAAVVGYRRLWERIRVVPKRVNILDAAGELILLSNSLRGGGPGQALENVNRVRLIEQLLQIYAVFPDPADAELVKQQRIARLRETRENDR